MLNVEQILRTAEEAGASDVHISVGISPMMRVGGRLIAMEFPKLLPADTLDILVNTMTEAQRELFEERGECDISFFASEGVRCRLSAYKHRGTVALAFRLVGNKKMPFEGLGIPDSVFDLYRLRQGLVLAAGSSGSGKTATLAAIIDKINSNREAHIITLEAPVEYVHRHKMSVVNQREIGIDSGSYANALRAALREDSDVILIDEMNDLETVSMALTAAETGHLVLAALNTVGAVDTVERLINIFPVHQQRQVRLRLANVLETVFSQQLLPASGFGGRVAAFEVMHANHTVRSLIREDKAQQLTSVMQNGRKQGMITMDEAILRLFHEGRIDKETADSYVQGSGTIEIK